MSYKYCNSFIDPGFGIYEYETIYFRIPLTDLGSYNKSITLNYCFYFDVIDNAISSPELINITPGYKILFTNTLYDFSINNDKVSIFDNSSWVDSSTYNNEFMSKSDFFSKNDFTSNNSYSFNIDSGFNYCYLVLVYNESYFNHNFTLFYDTYCSDTTYMNLTDTYESGYNQGNNVGYTNGYNDGYNEGNNVGYTNGHRVGYDEGYNVGFNEDNNFTKLFVSIGETPVNTFKQMLNFNILGVNVAQFVLSLFTLFIVVFGIKKLL